MGSDMPGVYGMPGVTSEINDGMSGTTIMPGKTLPIKTRRRLQNNKHEESGDSETELAKVLVTYLEMPATSRMFPSIALAKILYEKAKSFETPEISRITEYLEMPVIKKVFPTIALAKELYEKVKSWGLRRRLQGKSDRRKLGVFSPLVGILPGMSNPINTAITEHPIPRGESRTMRMKTTSLAPAMLLAAAIFAKALAAIHNPGSAACAPSAMVRAMLKEPLVFERSVLQPLTI